MTQRRTMPLALMALTVMSAACGRGSEPIRIAAPGPWGSGNNVVQRRAIELAVEEINRGAGASRRHVELLLRDDGASPARAVAIAEELVDDRSVLAVVGHVNSGAMLAASRLYDGHLPAVIATATSPDLTGVSPWVFRVAPSDSLSGATLGRAAGEMGWARAAVLYENDSYGRGLASAFRAGYAGELVAFDPIDRTTESFEPYLAVFRARGAQVVFVAGSEDSGLRLLRTARALRFPGQLMGGDGWLGVTTDTAASEGAYVAAVFSPDGADDRARGFIERYRARYGSDPDASAALAYDAVHAVGRALAAGATTRAGMREQLARITSDAPLSGVTGTVAFRADGDRAGSALVLGRVHEGALPVVWRGSGAR